MYEYPSRSVCLAAMVLGCAVLLGANATTSPAESARPTSAPAASGPATTAPPAAAVRHGRILVVPIEGEIDRIQGAFLHRALKDAKGNYDAVVFVLDTPGGDLFIMAEMSREITALSPRARDGERLHGTDERAEHAPDADAAMPTIAFVSNWAFSAGAFIAMSCDRIYMAPGSVIGAATGVRTGPSGPIKFPEDVAEKYASAERGMFRAIAEDKGYPKAIAQGMTYKDIEVTKVIYGGRTEYLTDTELDQIKSDPLKAEKLKVIEIVSPKGKLITLTADEAVRYDIARKVLPDLPAVLKEEKLDDRQIVRIEQNASDKIVGILTAPGIVGLLILIAFGAIWVELKMPGFGVPGTIAVVAFVLVFGSQFLVGNANALEILIFVIGLALLAIEIFITPGFGVLGGLGIACVFISLLLAMQPFTVPSAPWQFGVLKINLLATAGGVLGSLVLLVLFAWLIPGTPIFQRLTLKQELHTEEGYGSGVQEAESLIGAVGTVVTALRPAGKVEIGDRTYSVVSDGEFVLPGKKTRVLRVDGARIVVEPIKEEEPREPEFKA